MSASRSESDIDLVFEGAESREVGFVFQRVESGRVGHVGNDKVGHEFRQQMVMGGGGAAVSRRFVPALKLREAVRLHVIVRPDEDRQFHAGHEHFFRLGWGAGDSPLCARQKSRS